MTTAHERTKAVVETRNYLQILASDINCAKKCDLGAEAVRLLRHYPLDVDLDVSAAALPNVWSPAARHGRRVEDGHRENLPAALQHPTRRSSKERLLGMPDVGTDGDFNCRDLKQVTVSPARQANEAHKMHSDNQVNLEVALRRIRELALADGDLGYAYWYEVGRLLQQAGNMQSQIDTLNKELECCRTRLAKTELVRNRRT
ncbi:BPSL0761 family protein [Burkholderia cenocepacia]|uniref:BPSL0761 family protein n=1 Tax=Burkholderia cenocepacia TaxID=95486 RepID=UPI0021186DAA|nr:BPSL0761 family protein [Burkholderia cenocepacia]MCW3699595.1 hypothetical protein [Burkholderia cenocepacia]MCW3707204.1 hypothetical protein [Burkholderia cenocepacia]MCW3723477.1 hypothetical protein [Burkholderia cenocepacia]MCW3729529.1 hypothetical protein [Burkholderia cenocepacia]